MAKSVSGLLKFRLLHGARPLTPDQGLCPLSRNIGMRVALAMNVVPPLFKPWIRLLELCIGDSSKE
jgi:hypothetical protein